MKLLQQHFLQLLQQQILLPINKWNCQVSIFSSTNKKKFCSRALLIVGRFLSSIILWKEWTYWSYSQHSRYNKHPATPFLLLHSEPWQQWCSHTFSTAAHSGQVWETYLAPHTICREHGETHGAHQTFDGQSTSIYRRGTTGRDGSFLSLSFSLPLSLCLFIYLPTYLLSISLSLSLSLLSSIYLSISLSISIFIYLSN